MKTQLISLAALAAIALVGCDRHRDVVERDTRTVVHDQPVIIHEDRDHHDDHQPPGPPPPRPGPPDHRDDRR